MNYSREINKTEERMLAGGLLERVSAAYNTRLRLTGCGKLIDEYEAGMAAVRSQSYKAFANILDYNEKLYNSALSYAVKHAFRCGICAVFERHFSKKPSENPFEKYVEDELMNDSKPHKHVRYREYRDNLNSRTQRFSALLETELRGHIDAISVYWEDSVYGMLPYAFALGAEVACVLMRQILPSAVLPNFGKDLPGFDFEAEQAAALERALDKELMNKLLTLKDPECFTHPLEADSDEPYKRLRDFAISHFGAADINDLITAEELFEENLMYILRFAFAGGMYAGFEQVFDRDKSSKHFLDVANDLVGNELTPGKNKTERAAEYMKREDEISKIFERISKKLRNKGDIALEHDFIRTMRSEKLMAATFYLGYRYALNTADKDIIQTRKMRIKILRSEFDLRVITFRERQEHYEDFIKYLKADELPSSIRLRDFE